MSHFRVLNRVVPVNFSLKGWGNVRFEIGAERVDRTLKDREG